jgi:hypothetical protein
VEGLALNIPQKKPRRFLLTLAVLLLAGFGCVIVLVYLAMPRPPTDRELIQNFNKNRAAFEQLREMLQADTNLRRVASWGVETRHRLTWARPPGAAFQLTATTAISRCSSKPVANLRPAKKVSAVTQVFSFGHGVGLVIRNTLASAGWKSHRPGRFQRWMATTDRTNLQSGRWHFGTSMGSGTFGPTCNLPQTLQPAPSTSTHFLLSPMQKAPIDEISSRAFNCDYRGEADGGSYKVWCLPPSR